MVAQRRHESFTDGPNVKMYEYSKSVIYSKIAKFDSSFALLEKTESVDD
jgi:hypothetical protein